MLRFSELLMLLPVLVLVWVRLRTGQMPTGRLLLVTLLGMVVLGAGLAWFGNARALDGRYVPASLQGNGRIVAGHGAPPAATLATH